MNRPAWMSDPSISHISEEKLSFLSSLFEKVKGKNKNELMPFLMAMSKNKNNRISFTSEEMQLIIAAIKRAASAEEQKQIDNVLNMAIKKGTK